jgi:hypothetical protein
MTRFKLIPWLAIPALLLLAPVTPTATAATPKASISQEDGMQYLPMDEAPAWLEASGNTSLTTSAVGEVTVAQYGAADFLVANRNRFLAVRFDLPFGGTLSNLAFASRVQIPNATPGKDFASFRSVRILGADVAGNMDKTQTLFRYNRYLGSNSGAVNNIPLNLAITGGTFYAVFEFPAPVSGVADTFPFLYTDLQNTEAGLFANSYASDTAGVVSFPPSLGTFTGTTLLADQNINVALTCVVSGDAPPTPPSGTAFNARVAQVEFTSTLSGNDQLQLVRRDAAWTVIATGGGGSGKVPLPSMPADGIYGIRAFRSGNASVVSNVVVIGSYTTVGGTAPLGADADEPNGKMNETEATALTVPVSDHAGTIWPAGDQDNYQFYARPGDQVSVTASPTFVDFRNDLDLVVQLVDNSGDVLATASSPAPGEAAALTFTIPAQGGSSNLRRHFIHIVDRSGSDLDPLGGARVLVPPTYNMSVDVQTPATITSFGPQDAPVSGLLNSNDFAFVNTGANPVRGNANFGFVIPRSASSGASVRLRIYDVRGRMVATLVNGTRSAGTHFASWSGHDARGNRVASGPYFARLDTGTWSRVVRIDLVQ